MAKNVRNIGLIIGRRWSLVQKFIAHLLHHNGHNKLTDRFDFVHQLKSTERTEVILFLVQQAKDN